MEAKTGAIGAALIAAAATVTAAVIQVLSSDDAGPPPSTIMIADAAKEAQPPPSGFETLLAHLPDTITGCEPAETPVMALASARCSAAATTETTGATLYLTLFPDVEHARSDFGRQGLLVVGITEQACPDAPDRSDYQIGTRARRDRSPAGWPPTAGPTWSGPETPPGIVAVAQGQEGGTVRDLLVGLGSTPRSAEPPRPTDPRRLANAPTEMRTRTHTGHAAAVLCGRAR